jgi:predicted cytidylate kinase
MDRKKREDELGYLFVVGGPGGSGASTISKMLSGHFNLERVYSGGLFREEVRSKGYDNFEDFYAVANEDELLELDRKVDSKLVEESKRKNILMDSKLFACIAHIKGIACTVTIWLDASLHSRTLRHLGKMDISSPFEKVMNYFKIRKDLLKRWRLDSRRYSKLYGIDYRKPTLYNNIVINSSNMDEEETFNLILKKLEDGQYIKEQ